MSTGCAWMNSSMRGTQQAMRARNLVILVVVKFLQRDLGVVDAPRKVAQRQPGARQVVLQHGQHTIALAGRFLQRLQMIVTLGHCSSACPSTC